MRQIEEAIASCDVMLEVIGPVPRPVPFVAINLPDPFEHSQAVRLRYTPDELPTPPPITPRTPTK